MNTNRKPRATPHSPPPALTLVESSHDPHRIERPIDMLIFVTAGDAIFTVTFSAKRFTYKVTKSEEDEHGKGVFFVNVLTGPDNTADYSYLGVIPEQSGHPTAFFKLTKKSSAGKDADSVRGFAWFWRALTTGNDEQLSQIKFQHEGRCGRCGRTLTVPESIERGIGPDCAEIMGLAA